MYHVGEERAFQRILQLHLCLNHQQHMGLRVKYPTLPVKQM